MEAMEVEAVISKVLDTEQLVKQCFGKEEYAQLAASDRIRYRIMCTRYLETPDIAQKYSLKEYLNTNSPKPETIFKELTGAPRVYPPPKSDEGKFRYGHSSTGTPSDGSALRKPTLEEMWDASDSEHALERGVQRERAAEQVLGKKKPGQAIKKRGPPKKRGRKKKFLLKPKLKLAGKPRGRKKKNPLEPPAPSATRSKTAPVTRSQVRKVEPKSDTAREIEIKSDAAREIEIKSDTAREIEIKSDTAGETESKSATAEKPESKSATVGKIETQINKPGKTGTKSATVGKTVTKRVTAGKTETKGDTAGKTETKNAKPGKTEAKSIKAGKTETKGGSAGKAETKSDTAGKTPIRKTTVKRKKRATEKTEIAKNTGVKAVPENAVAREVTQNSDGDNTENPEARYAPPAKKRKTPVRRFIPPPPPPCFYNSPPGRRRDSYIDSLTPPLPNPSYRNIELCTSLQTCKCRPPPPRTRHFPADIIDLTESSDSDASANQRHFSLQDSSQLPHIPLLPPPLAPLSHIRLISEPSSGLSVNNDLGISSVRQKSSSETTTVYYVPRSIQPADNSDLIISPGFYVPRTLEELPGQPQILSGEGKTSVGFFVPAEKLQTSGQISQHNVTEQQPTSTLYVQQMQTQYRDVNKPSKTSKSHQSLPVTSSSFVPTVQANTTTPYSITYVNSQPLTSSTFAVPDTPLTVSFTKNVNMTAEMKAKILKIARSSITSIPIIMPEREKRMQPKRLINRKKFIIAPKSRMLLSDQESDPPVFRPFQDLTKSLENRQNIGASQSKGAFLKALGNMLPRQEIKPEITRTTGMTSIDIQGQEKRSAQIKLPEPTSSDTTASAEIKAITKREKRKIIIPPHVLPCPTHCPSVPFQTKPFLTTANKGKIQSRTEASSEVFVSLSQSQVMTFQEAQAEAFSTLSRPLSLGNIGPVPVQATYVQQQLRTYAGPGKRGRFISSGSQKIIAKTEVKTIEAPIIQLPIFQVPAGQASPIEPLILQPPNIPLTVTVKQEGTSGQLAVIQPLVSLYPGVKPTLNKPPEKFGKRPFQTDSSASASDDDEEVITIEFPPGVDQSQIQALSSAQLVDPESIKYITTRKYAAYKAGQSKLVKVPRLQVNPPVDKRPTQYKAIAPKTEQTTSTRNKAPITTKKKIKTILPKPILSKSAGLNYSIINYTESQITTTASKSEYTLSNSNPPYFTVTTTSQITMISTGSVQTLSTTEIKNIGTKIGQTRSISTSTDLIASTRPQISTYPAKTVETLGKSIATIVNQPQIKTGVPIKIVQTLCMSAQTTQSGKTIFTNTKMVQTTNTSSMTTQLKIIPRIDVVSEDGEHNLIQGSEATIQSDTALLGSDAEIQNPDTAVQGLETADQESKTAIQVPKTAVQGSVSETAIQGSNTAVQGSVSETAIQGSVSETAIQGSVSETVVQAHVPPTQIKQGSTAGTSSNKNQSGTKRRSTGRNMKLKRCSPQSTTLPRRRGRPSIFSTVMSFKKLAESQSKVSKRPALHPVKVANFQKLITEVQKSVTLSKSLNKKVLAAEKATKTAPDENTESAIIMDEDQHPQIEVERSSSVPQTSALATTSGTLSHAAIPPLKNIKILTPLRTSAGDILTNDSLSELHTLSTQSGATRISLVKPGIYQVVHTTSTGHSQPRLYTANEMLAAEVLTSDLKTDLRKVVYKRVKQDARSLRTVVTFTTRSAIDDTTSTSATSTASTTSSLPDEETPEMEETPKIDEPETDLQTSQVDQQT